MSARLHFLELPATRARRACLGGDAWASWQDPEQDPESDDAIPVNLDWLVANAERFQCGDLIAFFTGQADDFAPFGDDDWNRLWCFVGLIAPVESPAKVHARMPEATSVAEIKLRRVSTRRLWETAYVLMAPWIGPVLDDPWYYLVRRSAMIAAISNEIRSRLLMGANR